MNIREAIVLALTVTAVACAPSGGGGGADATALPTGTVWLWTALAGSDALEVTDPGRYSLELLDDGNYAMRADCNTGGGAYTLKGDHLSLGPGRTTMMACAPDSQGDRFAALLGDVAGFAVDGERLTLALGSGDTMEFAPLPAIDLAGTSWLVTGYNNSEGGVVSVAAGTTLYLTFGEDGRMAGSAGCNTLNTSYELDGQTITPGKVATTRMFCPGEPMRQETAFVAALGTIATWDARGERLQLRQADGALAVDLVSAVAGTVTYRVRRALPPNAEIKVSLQDVSLADAPAKVIGEHVMTSGEQQVPIPFTIAFDQTDIDPRHTYGMRATIHVDGKMMFTSTQAYPVITGDGLRYDVAIEVEPVG